MRSTRFKSRPAASAGIVAALALFFAREPLMDLAGKMVGGKKRRKKTSEDQAKSGERMMSDTYSGNERRGRQPNPAIDEAPLVALAAGVAAGALVAALLPVTRREKELLAPMGDRVTNAARDAADAARRAGSDKLRELGLTPDSVAEKFSEAGRATAQAAIGRLRDEQGKD